MVKVRSIMNKFKGYRKEAVSLLARDDMFATRDEVQWLFKLSSMQCFELFKFMDKEHMFRISLFDLWGSLILMAQDISVEEKIENIFELVDYSGNGWIPLSDLKLIMMCATRGLSRIKNIHVFTGIDKFIKIMLQFSNLNEKGEITLRDIRAYMLMDENCRAYFAALGAAAVIVDTGMLVKQRREVMQNLAELEKSIKELALHEKISEEDKEAYDKERGGDSANLKVSKALMREAVKNDNQPVEEVEVHEDDGFGEPSLEQRARRLQRAKSGSGEIVMISDAVIFADPNARKKNQASGDSFDENSIINKWAKLEGVTDDNLRPLSIDLVEDLFEHAGITLTDEDVEEYMQTVEANPLNMRDVNGIINWYRNRITHAAPTKGRPPLWRRVAIDAVSNIEDIYSNIWGVASLLQKQKSVSDNIKKKKEYLQDIIDVELAQKEEEEAAAKAAKLGLTERTEEVRIGTAGSPGKRRQGGQKKKGGSVPGRDVAGELKGSVRLAAWQRQSLQQPATNKMQCNIVFGRPELAPKPEKKKDSVMTQIKKKMNKTEAKNPDADAPIIYKMQMNFGCAVSIPANDRPKFYNEQTNIIEEPDEFAALELLDVLKKKDPDFDGSGPAELPFGTIGWFSLNIADGTTKEEEHILSTTIENMFNSIPEDYRVGSYTAAQTRIFNLPLEEEDDDDFDPDTVHAPKEIHHHRIMIVGLLHEVDRFQEMEEMLPANILISRSLRNIAIQVKCISSIKELYDSSLPFESFEDRLFGPQEDEIGEEGMNPLRFAKLQRQRLNAAQTSIEKATDMAVEKIKQHLEARGLSVAGNSRQLVRRVKKAFQRQADISGFGELSAFGSDMSKLIFNSFRIDEEVTGKKLDPKNDKESKAGKKNKASQKEEEKEKVEEKRHGLSLWDFNQLLYRTGAPTLYDIKEYQSAMDQLELLIDKDGLLLPDGLSAYHELYGGLSDDMRNIGIGSLDDKLKGQVKALAQYDGEGIASLLTLIESHSILYKPLKVFLAFLTSISDLSYSAEFESLYDLFSTGLSEDGKDIRKMIRTPGWLSAKIHSLSEWLADGDKGFLVSMRRSVYEVYGRFNKYEEVFPEALSKPGAADTSSNSATLTTSDGPDSDAVSDDEGNAAVAESAKESNAAAAKHAEEVKEHEFEVFTHRLDDLLPPRSDGNSPEINKKTLDEKVALNKKIIEILSDFDQFPLDRDQREGLTTLKEEVVKGIASTKVKIEESKQLACAHFCSAYDAVRIYTDGIGSIGWGTKEFYVKSSFHGADISQFLPKGYGEASIPRQKRDDKIERAHQRKKAAFAAIEREKLRRNGDSEENQERKAAKQAAVAAKRSKEELALFVDAMDGLVASRYGGKSSSDLATIARLWEKLAATTLSRYPGSVKSAVHANNCSCGLKEMYSIDHFKGKEAIMKLDAACMNLMKLVNSYSDVPERNMKDETKRGGILSKKQQEDLEERLSAYTMVIQRESKRHGGDMDDDEGEGHESGSDDDESESIGTHKDKRGSDELSLGPRTETITIPDADIVPIFCVLQNYITILREAQNAFLMNKTDRIKRVILALSDILVAEEANPLLQKNSMPFFGEVNILIMGQIGGEASITAGEVRALLAENESNAYSDTDSNPSTARSESSETREKREEDERNQADAALLKPAEAVRYKRRSSVAVGAGAPMAAGSAKGGSVKGGQLPSLTQEEMDTEAIMKKEREKKRLKSENQRKLDAIKRRQVIKQRNKLYDLIGSNKISAIFDQKAGSVLAEGADIRWGDEEAQNDALGFLEDTTEATTDSESDDESEMQPKKKKKSSKKGSESGSQKSNKSSKSGGGSGKDKAEKGKKAYDDLNPAGQAAEEEEEGKSSGFFSFLFRNRDKPK